MQTIGKKRTATLALLAVFAMTAASTGWAGDLRVDTDFSGASGQLVSINQGTREIEIRPARNPGKGWECWWCVRIHGLSPGEEFMLTVSPSPWATPNQAAISADGLTWRHSSIGQRMGKKIRYRIQAKRGSVFAAWGPRFSIEDSTSLVDRVAKHAGVQSFKLCQTRGRRPVWALRFEPPEPKQSEPRFGIWIQARQHAWEAGSSWVCQGVIEWLTSDSPESQWLRERASIVVVPSMDVDSVAVGAGGKNQQPQDHNRDWTANPHWPAVVAAQKGIQALDKQGRFDLFIDLHNPGASTRHPYFYVAPRKVMSSQAVRNLDRFLASVKQDMRGPLEFRGSTQESGATYDKAWKAISKNWVTMNTKKHVVAVTLETAWNTPHSNQSGYRTVGQQLGAATARYFRTNPRE